MIDDALFDDHLQPNPAAEGERRKQAGMNLAADHVADAWKDAFRRTVESLARTGAPFTADDVIGYVGLPTGSETQNRNNAVGAMLNGLARRKVIVQTGQYRKGTRPASHSRMIAEWRGNV